jgi:hypothetical protein
MIPKVKRMRLNKMRQKFAVGDEARKFSNIPTASKPVQQTVGERNQYLDKYVAGQIKSPELADAAKQQYTKQTVQADELISGTTMTSPTDIQDVGITKAAITAPTSATATQVQAPGTFNVATMTGATGTAQTGTAQTGTVGTQAQVGTVTGTLSGTTTGATAAPTTSAIAQASQGQLSAGALAQVVSGTAATVNGQTAYSSSSC